jgi:hypothetical protein
MDTGMARMKTTLSMGQREG